LPDEKGLLLEIFLLYQVKQRSVSNKGCKVDKKLASILCEY